MSHNETLQGFSFEKKQPGTPKGEKIWGAPGCFWRGISVVVLLLVLLWLGREFIHQICQTFQKYSALFF